jgi:hypothetical protein
MAPQDREETIAARGGEGQRNVGEPQRAEFALKAVTL